MEFTTNSGPITAHYLFTDDCCETWEVLYLSWGLQRTAGMCIVKDGEILFLPYPNLSRCNVSEGHVVRLYFITSRGSRFQRNPIQI